MNFYSELKVHNYVSLNLCYSKKIHLRLRVHTRRYKYIYTLYNFNLRMEKSEQHLDISLV